MRPPQSRIGVCAALTLAGAAHAQCPPTWTNRFGNVALLAERRGVGLTFDSLRNRTILFAGISNVFKSDIWEWNGSAWTSIGGFGPGARSQPVFIFQPARARALLFGGYGTTTQNPVPLGDTWEWNPSNNSWTQLFPNPAPPARYHHAAALNSDTGLILLFGGIDLALARNDTWEFNGATGTWTQRLPPNAPPIRYDHAMAYDAARQRTVLFGGGLTSSPFYRGDTWLWDGSNWSQQTTPNSPSPRRGHVMAYNAATQRIILFGGFNGTYLGDTWEYDGVTWNPLAGAAPNPRDEHAMTFDSSRAVMVMYGGTNGSLSFGEVWEHSRPLPPSISMQPSPPASSACGSTISLSVAASGSPAPTFQWRRNSTNLVNGPTGSGSTIAGATLPTLQVFNASTADSGLYDCVVANTCASVPSNIVAITVADCCYPNCDASTAPPVLNVNDFICFQNAFAAGYSSANCDASTSPPVLNVNDFICFQNAFAAGCS